MAALLTVIGAILQVVLLLIQSHNAKEDDVKKLHADNAKKITDAIASGDTSAIHRIFQQLRR